MRLKRTLIQGLAIGLLALGGWKAFSHWRDGRPAAAAPAQWICPMRCLNRFYGDAGDCPVCHMKLVPFKPQARKKLGYHCPLHRSEQVFAQGGACPYCGLALKELYEGGPPPLPAQAGLRLWPQLGGKTAVYFRPYEVRAVGVERILRVAGPLRGLRLSARLADARRLGLRPGGSAMVMPPEGYARPVLATVEALGPGERLSLRLSRPIPGADWASAELRVATPPAPAVPLTALWEEDGPARVFVMNGEAFEPRAVSVTVRGESYAAVEGLRPGETVAGSGVFWLEAEWRMQHP